MSDDVRNETRTSYQIGWDYGHMLAQHMAVYQPLLAVPPAIEEEGCREQYHAGYEDGFHDAKESHARNGTMPSYTRYHAGFEDGFHAAKAAK